MIDWPLVRDIAKDFIVPLAGAGAGAWASFAVFQKQSEENRRTHEQNLIQSLAEDNDRQNKLAEKNLVHFAWLLDEVISFAGKQNTDYLTTAEKIEQNLKMPHPLVLRASGTMSRIFAIKQDDIFFSLIRKALDTADNRARIANVYSQLDFISISIDANRLTYKEHIKTYHAIGLEYRENIEKIRDLISAVIEESKRVGIFESDDLTNYLSNVQYHYLTSLNSIPEASGLDWHHLNYLRPMMKDLLDDFRDDIRTDAILNVGRRNNILMGRIEHSSSDAVESLKQANASLSTALDKLQKQTDYIKQVLLTT